MLIVKASPDQIRKALALTNATYGDNIRFRHFDGKGKGFSVRIAAIDSKGPGGRLGTPKLNGKQNRIGNCACWHATGDFMDNLFAVAPSAEVHPSPLQATVGRITAEAGNWQDWQIGSEAFPFMMSDACECDR